MPAKWIILDLMGVIFEVGDDVNDLLVPYVRKRNSLASPDKINKLYVEASLGKMSSFDLWEELGFMGDYPDIEKDYLDTCLTIDPEFRDIALSLARSYSLAILSNDVKEWSDYLRSRFHLNELFKAVVISGEVGYRKPDERIYTILLDRIGLDPLSCVLIDDRSKNLRIASQLGMKTIKFLREDLAGDSFGDFEITSFSQLPEIVDRVFK